MVAPAISISNALKRHSSDDSVFELAVPELSLMPGEICVVAGRSGCGKTSLLDILGCISGFEYCDRFEMNAGGSTLNLAELSDSVRAAVRLHYIGYVLQQGGLLPFLTARENMMLPLQMQRRRPDATQLSHLVESLGIADQLSKYPSALSVGQRQRVCVARALVTKPHLILADEPTGALDPLSAAEVKQQLFSSAKETGSTLVIVTHDVELFGTGADTLLSFEIRKSGDVTRSTLRRQENTERRESCSESC